MSNIICDEWRRWAALQRICVDLEILIGAEVERREGRERMRSERRIERFERGFGVSGG
jgi:hypothetical protein